MRVVVPILWLLGVGRASYIGGWFGWGGAKKQEEVAVEQPTVIPTFRTIKDYDFSSTYEDDYSVESDQLIKKSIAEEIVPMGTSETKSELIEFSDEEDGSLFGISGENTGLTESTEVKTGTVLGGHGMFYPEKQEKKKKQRVKRKKQPLPIPIDQVFAIETAPVNVPGKNRRNQFKSKRIERQVLEEPTLEDLVSQVAETEIARNIVPDEEEKPTDIFQEDLSEPQTDKELIVEEAPEFRRTPSYEPDSSSSFEFDISPIFSDLNWNDFKMKTADKNAEVENSNSSFEMDISPLFTCVHSDEETAGINRPASSSSSFEFDVAPIFEDLQFDNSETKSNKLNTGSSSSFEFDVRPLFDDLQHETVLIESASSSDEAAEENFIAGTEIRIIGDISSEYQPVQEVAEDFSDIFGDGKSSSDLVFVERPIFDSSSEDEVFIREEPLPLPGIRNKNDPFGLHVNVLTDGSILASASHRSHPPSLPPQSPRSTSSFFLVSEDGGLEDATCTGVGCLFRGGWSSVHLRGPSTTWADRSKVDATEFVHPKRQQQHRTELRREFSVQKSSLDLEALWLPSGNRHGRHDDGQHGGIQADPRDLIEQQRRAYQDMSNGAVKKVTDLDEVLVEGEGDELTSPTASLSSSISEEFFSSVRNRFRTIFTQLSAPSSSSSTSSEGPLMAARRSISEFFSSDRQKQRQKQQPYIPIPQPKRADVEEHTVSTGSKEEEVSSLFPGLSLWTRRFRSAEKPRNPRPSLFSGLF